MKASPPRFAIAFLHWFCREDCLEEIEGNLVELFDAAAIKNIRAARWAFTFGVLSHFRPEFLRLFARQKNINHLISLAMLKNYLLVTWRNLARRSAFSMINIGGLAIGICACLMILAYIDFETSYDNFHAHGDDVYRIIRTAYKNNEPQPSNVMTTYGCGPALVSDVPGIRRAARTHNESTVVTYENGGTRKAFHESNIIVTDPAFFEIFTFKALSGKLSDALKEPNSIVISRSVAARYFDNEVPIGKMLMLRGGRIDGTYTVTAVIEDVPANSHFSFDMVLPIHNLLATRQYSRDNGWSWNNFITYVELHPGVSAAGITSGLDAFSKSRLDPPWKGHNMHFSLSLQPLRSIHLRAGSFNAPGISHDVSTVSTLSLYCFGLIAVFVLMIAWINYVNLSTARAAERMREVGIKKTIGVARGQLVFQFLFEAMLINLTGILLALVLLVCLLPKVGLLIDKKLSVDFGDARLWMTVAALFVAGSMASGIYPAFVMSSLGITQALKKTRSRFLDLRKVLVAFQFGSSLLLIAGTLVVYLQLQYMESRDKGLQLDQMLVVAGPGSLQGREAQRRLKTFKDEVLQIPNVEAIATSASIPGREHNWGTDVRKINAPPADIKLGRAVWIDTDFIPTYDIRMIAGKNFDPRVYSDMESVIINEAATSAFGLGTPAEAVGQQILLDDDTVTVLGVTANYNWNSLKTEYAPFLFLPDTIQTIHVSIHLRGSSFHEAIEKINEIYTRLMPDDPFEYAFLDETFNKQYKEEQMFGKLFALFAGLAIAIACLGLWGLASFTTSQKLREIGIRKVLGASAGNIVFLLSGQVLLLVLVSSLIAVPFSWYIMDAWLTGFAFRITLEWPMFVVPIAGLLVLALFTMSLQILRGAMMNPVNVLRRE